MNDDSADEHDGERPAESTDWSTDAAGFPVLGPSLLGFDPDDERDDDVTADDAAFVTAMFGTALRDEPEGGRSPLAIMAVARVSKTDVGEVRRIVERERRSARIRRWVGGTVAAAAVVTFAAVVVPNLGTNSSDSGASSDSATVAATSVAGTVAGSEADSGSAVEEMAPSSSGEAAGGGQAPVASVPATAAAASSVAASSAAAQSEAAPAPGVSQPGGLSTAPQTLTTSAAAGTAADRAACPLPPLSDPALSAARSALGLPADTIVEPVTGACDAGVVGAAVFPAAGVQVVVAAPGSTCAAGLCPTVQSGELAEGRDQLKALAAGQRFVVVVSALPDGTGPDGGNLDPQRDSATGLQRIADSVQAALN